MLPNLFVETKGIYVFTKHSSRVTDKCASNMYHMWGKAILVERCQLSCLKTVNLREWSVDILSWQKNQQGMINIAFRDSTTFNFEINLVQCLNLFSTVWSLFFNFLLNFITITLYFINKIYNVLKARGGPARNCPHRPAPLRQNRFQRSQTRANVPPFTNGSAMYYRSFFNEEH